MLVIDALNEGRGTDVWREHLASFVREVTEHDHIVLVLSCREEYLDYVVPPELIAGPQPYPREDGGAPEDCAPLGKLVPVRVEGFRTMGEREAALQKFMDDKGIARPTAPVLDTEFFNPLFMSSVCRSMATAGIKVFPRGLRGARGIFGFVLATKARALGTRHDGNTRVHGALLAALNDLAGAMVERRADHVPLRDAVTLIDSAFGEFPISDQTWLGVLEGSDVLRRDVEGIPGEAGPWTRPSEVVRFSFQRLQDNLIAEHLVGECSGIDIEDAFEPEAPLAFLVRRTQEDGAPMLKPDPRWLGVLGAVWAAVAERYGRELWHLQSFSGSPDARFCPHDFRPVFRTSIRERTGTAFSSHTWDILNCLWENQEGEKLAIILSASCVPGHAWDAGFLHNRLSALAAGERKSVWSQWITDGRSEPAARSEEIADWALTVDTAAADAEVVRLAAIVLTWLCAADGPMIRQRSACGLSRLLGSAADLLPYLRGLFCSVEHPNIRERLDTPRSGRSGLPARV